MLGAEARVQLSALDASHMTVGQPGGPVHLALGPAAPRAHQANSQPVSLSEVGHAANRTSKAYLARALTAQSTPKTYIMPLGALTICKHRASRHRAIEQAATIGERCRS